MKVIPKLILLIVYVSLISSTTSGQLSIVDPVCEYRCNPIGIDVKIPRLSWKILSEEEDVTQKAYEIRAAGSPSHLGKRDRLLWSSGRVESGQSLHVEYAGPPLQSMQRVYWQVRIRDNRNKWSKWSDVAFWEMGMLDTGLWQADWITIKDEKHSEESLPAQYFRKEFACSKRIKSARVHVTSLGIYQLFINGQKVGDDLFTPGFTTYERRIQYQTYDVTSMLGTNNAIGAIVGDGWYRGYMGWHGEKALYGDQLALFVQLHIDYEDGAQEIVTSGKSWKTSYGAILESDIYNGEIYDARLEHEACFIAGFDDSSWSNAAVISHPKDILVASNSIPVKAIEEIRPIEILTTPKGELVLDMGQNMVGWVRMLVRGKEGDRVTLQFAEALDKEGNFYTKNLRAAKATDVYILRGDDEEIYEPYFTFHGFRFVKLTGYPGEVTLDDITGVVIHSDMKQTGTFSCSDSLINRLQQNIQWGQRGNFLDIPTDCPQRDERAGWTGDAQVFSMTAAFNYDVAAFYTKWLKDLALDQKPDGAVPNVVPDILNDHRSGATAWADASVVIPWTVFRAYGDKRILEEQYESMKSWVDYMDRHAGDDYLWIEPGHWHWGDWLAYNTDRPDYAGSVTEKDLIATAYFHYSTTLLSKIARITGKGEDAQHYEQLAEKIKTAFGREYITPNGRLVSHTQTAYALAISFGLIPDELKEKSAAYFADDIQKFKHLTTGFVGTPLLCSTLSKIGRDDLAYMLLNRKEFPGWLYPVTQGATTIWERWDTQRPDGTIIEGMNSFNHYAYGAIGEWLYSHVAGIRIDPDKPAYRHIFLHPHPGGGLSHAEAEIQSMYGMVGSAWKIEDGVFTYTVQIPPNTTASLTLPRVSANEVVLISKLSGKVAGNELIQKDDDVVLELGSGIYQFSYPALKFN